MIGAADIAKISEFNRFDRCVHLADFYGQADTAVARTLMRTAQMLAKEYPDFPDAFRRVHPNKTVLLDEAFKEDLLNAPRGR